MTNILTIFKREIRAYFNSPIAYIFIIVFLLLMSGLFMGQFFLISLAGMRSFFVTLPLALCIFLPAVTMGLWAEDRKGNTLELLLTFPMKTHELVLGKFAASFFFFVVTIATTFTIPVMISLLGKPDFGVIGCQYLGAILMGSFFISLGILISGFCKDQIVSFILTMMACFGLFILGTDFSTGSIDGWIPGVGTFLRNSLGMIQHFGSFQRGVIDNRDALYFIVGSIIFLTLNGFWLESRLRPKAKLVFLSTSLISFAIFILVNVIFADLPIGRFDLTESKIHTVSSASKEILRDLKAPVTIKLYISPADKMPSGLKTLERNLRDKLDEFKAAAKGRFDYKVFHLEAANVPEQEGDTLEKSIQKKGVMPFQVRSIEADEYGVRLIYSALSIAYKEKSEEIIARIVPDDLMDLEYRIISKIHKMSVEETPVVALVAPYRNKTQDAALLEVLGKLEKTEADKLRDDSYKMIPRLLTFEGYEVKRIALTEDEPIPENTKTLVILEPENLNARQRFEINRFMVNGGSLLCAVQHYSYEYSSYEKTGVMITPKKKNPNINPLLKEWGLGIDENFLMDMHSDTVSLDGGRLFGFIPVSMPVRVPIQIKIIGDQMNKDLSITSNLPPILYLWGTAVNVDHDKLNELDLRSQILFSSSPEAWTVPFHEGAMKNEDFNPSSKENMRSYPLGVLIEGQFPDVFKDKEAPSWPSGGEDVEGDEASYEESEDLKELAGPGKLVLIGSAAIFSEQLFNKGGHTNLFLNSIDAITLGGKLIEVRGKRQITRSIKRLSPASKAGWRIFATFAFPVILAMIGSLRLLARKRSKWAYLKRA
ncbi:Gldg family protein [Candidatus Omnitrophota bacterium]